jgi:hypothetical protein
VLSLLLSHLLQHVFYWGTMENKKMKMNWNLCFQSNLDGISRRNKVYVEKNIYAKIDILQQYYQKRFIVAIYQLFSCNISFIHSSDILSIRFKHTRILRFFGLFKKYLKILDTKANFQAFVFLLCFFKNTWKYFFLSTFKKYSYFVCHYAFIY